MVLYGLIPAVWAFDPRIWLLYLVLPASEAVGMVFSVASVTAVRNLVDGDRITEANSRLNATAAAAGVLGPMSAGVVTASFGATAAIAVDAASFAVSAACLYHVRLRRRPAHVPGAATPHRDSPWREFSAGARFLWAHPVLRPVTLLLCFFSFLTLGLSDLLIYHLKHDLSRSDGTVGTVLAVAAAGSFAGSLLVAPLRRKLGFGASWIGAQALCGIVISFLGAARDVPLVAVLAAVWLGCIAVAGTCSMSLRQQVTPDALLGRVTSAHWTIQFSLGPVGAVTLTFAVGHFGAAALCLIVGASCVVAAGLALLTPVRRPLRDLPSRAS
jgi:hypothetical protein